MKMISENLGRIIAALAAIAVLVCCVTGFRAPVSGFFDSILDREQAIGESVLGKLDDLQFDMNGEGGAGGSSEPEVVSGYTQEDIDNSNGMLVAIGSTNPLYVVAEVSNDFSTITITKNGENSDGKMMDFPMGYVANLGLPLTNVVVKSGVANIGSYMISNCNTVANVSIPSSVRSIGSGAFYSTGLTNITIPNGVISIGDWAFYLCKNLTNVVIPDSVTSIGESSFYRCYGLTSVKIDGSGSTSIGDSAFQDCSELTNLVISDGVASIGTNAFGSCVEITRVNIPDSVIYIDSNAFPPATEFIVSANNQDYSSEDGVLYTKNMTTLVRYPSGKAYTSFVVPDGVTHIGSSAFSSCSNLTSVVIPDSVTSIGSFAFFYCTNLTSLTISNGVPSIESYAFAGCSGLTSVVIPSSVNTIGDCAFSGCTDLMNIKFNGTVAQWNSISKDTYWKPDVPATEVVCSDGTVSLS